jgi:general secretion pathway protein H
MKKQGGFSLIEVLVVLLIIGFSVKMVTFAARDSDFESYEEAILKTQQMLNLASEYATLNQLELGFMLDKQQLELLHFDGKAWQSVTIEGLETQISFPKNIQLELVLEDLPWARENLLSEVDWRALLEENEEQSLVDEEKIKLPQVLLLSSGEVSPFELLFTLAERPEFEYKLQGKFETPITLLTGDEEEQ